MDDSTTPEDAGSKHRYMVEDIAVTPFFNRHKKHMPATIKLHAEIREEKGHIILESNLSGYTSEDIQVSATPNSIDVNLILDRTNTQLKFHNSYHTPVPIVPSKIVVEQKNGILKVSAPIK